MYEDITLTLFANGYLSVVSEESRSIQGYMLTHLRQIFEDVEVYRWRSVREYHAAWLQLLKQGRATWGDEQKRGEPNHLMVWSRPALSSKISQPTSNLSASGICSQNSWLGDRHGFIPPPLNQVIKPALGTIRAIAQAMRHILLISTSAAFV